MPSTPPKPCRHPGCAALVRDGSGYCQAHKRVAPGSFADRARGTRHERGYDASWDRRRKLILIRDCGLCVPCRERGRVTVATQVDHKVAKAKARRLGWTKEQIEADANLQSICDDCHRQKTDREKNEG